MRKGGRKGGREVRGREGGYMYNSVQCDGHEDCDDGSDEYLCGE